MNLGDLKRVVDRAYEMVGEDAAVYVNQAGEITRCNGVLVNVEYAEDGSESSTVEVLGPCM